jgi:hypothetical protein
MTFIIDKDGPVPQLESEIHRLRGLVHALEGIRRGRHPGKAALAAFPKITSWRAISRPDPCLTGTMFNHPTIADGRQGITTGLWVLAPALGYARTVTRFYALGRTDRSCAFPTVSPRT